MELVSYTVILVFCLVAFAAIHSLTASLPFKRFVRRILGPGAEKFYLPVYSLIAFVTIAPLVYLFIKDPGSVLYIVPSPWRWLMVGGQVIAALVAPRAMLDAPYRFKLRSQLAAPKTPDAGPLDIRGIYRWVRDPFLLTGLIIIWLTPFMTVNLLVIYTFSTSLIFLFHKQCIRFHYMQQYR